MTAEGKCVEATLSNHAVLVTAARLRFGMNVKGLVRAAARDGERSAASERGQSAI
jgi:hypothetical protein